MISSKLSSAIYQAFWYSILENPYHKNRRSPLALAQPSLIAMPVYCSESRHGWQ
ncbi:hypothetical protein [Nostoc sp. NMS8]|uniref:hypothetical protein n=1 Tax=Nostoc sp. NMS8 TaxID=2815392 RepID=UPI0025FA5666|nr:hypothetical protein [Nostoc sp. NMS8]MBN3959659.1 hypothetical protein [Nostoc sp. NMS8]